MDGYNKSNDEFFKLVIIITLSYINGKTKNSINIGILSYNEDFVLIPKIIRLNDYLRKKFDINIEIYNKNKNYDLVRDDVKAVVEAANGTLVKVILETCLLTEDEIKKACELCVEAKADYVKTSTGFSTRGATIEDVRIMKEAVHGKAKVKAAGGVRTPEDMVKIVAAGADRIGTSAGCSLVKK